jgi:hypothetical protein
MAITTTMRVMILVKAAPALTSALQETMCAAAPGRTRATARKNRR